MTKLQAGGRNSDYRDKFRESRPSKPAIRRPIMSLEGLSPDTSARARKLFERTPKEQKANEFSTSLRGPPRIPARPASLRDAHMFLE